MPQVLARPCATGSLLAYLVAPTTARVSDLMDRRYVTLKATDTQGSAVEVFRREDRSALPVIDTAGVLIGVVTIHDVLDVAEEEATRAIQQIGGSEALGKPCLRHLADPDGSQAAVAISFSKNVVLAL